MSNEHSTQPRQKRDLVVTRVFDAPVEHLWQAWSDPEYVMQWWGPEGFTSPLAHMDFREGGTSLVCMRSPAFETGTYSLVGGRWKRAKDVPRQRPTQHRLERVSDALEFL